MRPGGEIGEIVGLDGTGFEPGALIDKLRACEDEAALEAIQEQLRSQLTYLKQQLYHLINQDYPQFMELANGLHGVDERANALRTPLVDLLEAAEALHMSTQQSRETLEAHLRHRQSIKRRQRAFKRCYRFTETLITTERLLGVERAEVDELEDEEGDEEGKDGTGAPQGEGGGGGRGRIIPTTSPEMPLRECCVVLERAAHASLILLADLRSPDAAVVPAMQELANRAKKLQHEVLKQLTGAFVDIVTPPDKFQAKAEHVVDPEALVPCLRALAALERGEEVEKHYGTLLMQPFIHVTFTHGNMDAGGARGSCKGLAAMYKSTLTYVSKACGPTLKLAEATLAAGGSLPHPHAQSGGGLTAPGGKEGEGRSEELHHHDHRRSMAIDLLCNGVWAPLQRELVVRLGESLFSLGIADTIHANYVATAAFIDKLSTVVGDDPALQTRAKRRILAHPATRDLAKRWNLPVYFQLRFTEISSAVDAAFRQADALRRLEHCSERPVAHTPATPDSAGGVGDVPRIVPFTSSASRPGDGGAAADKRKRPLELVVTAQVHDALAKCWQTSVFLDPLAHRFIKLTVQILRRAEAWLRCLVRPPGDDKDSSAPLPPTMWTPPVETLALVSWDVERLVVWVTSDLQTHIRGKLSAAAHADVEALLGDAVAPLSRLMDHAWAKICKTVADQCIVRLQAVKGITATYRMTNKPAPTQPSPFVPELLEPLRGFNKSWGSKVPETHAGRWKRGVLSGVVEEYRKTALDLMTTVRQMEDALKKRMRSMRSKAAAKDDAAQLSDADKIWLQLYLDVREFGAELERHGVLLAEEDSYQALWKEVEPAKKFLA